MLWSSDLKVTIFARMWPAEAAVAVSARSVVHPDQVTDIEFRRPLTTAMEAADDVAGRFYTPALENHCRRSFVWAAALGDAEAIGYDRELLYVAALLHDIGLTPAFDNVADTFEDTGAVVAWVFAAAAGWSPPRRVRAGDIIVAHMADQPPSPQDDAEGHLLARATAFDISGTGRGSWDAELQAQVLADYPRLGLSAEFLGHFTDQARRKPHSSSAVALRGGIDARIMSNSLDRG